MQKIKRFQQILNGSIVSVATLAQPGIALVGGSSPQTVGAQIITVNTTAPATAFPHFWEHMFGSCRANISLREQYREDLRKTKSIVDIQYVRCHGIFDDEMGVYDEDKDGKPIYNWTLIDQVYDGYLANGIRPFVELSFMPNKLATDPTPNVFWYKGNANPPKDWDKWAELNFQFGNHLVQRYGIDEVSKWYFEVWNEPNIDFWLGEPKEASYVKLYDVTARALKRVSPRIRVGGPSTAQAAWVDKLIDHCVKENVPIDFVSTHVYANDTAENVLGTKENIPRSEMVARAMRKVHDQVKASRRPEIPIIWSEFNASFMNEQSVTDAPFMGPWMANLIRQADGLASEMSYWTFSDVFEEQGVAKTPFYGGFGLIATGGIPKAAFNAFKLLHLLGEQRIACESDSVIATKRNDGTIVLASWNYFAPEEAGLAKTRVLKLNGVAANSRAQVYIIDKDHGSPLAAWQKMGSPAFPSRDQQRALRDAGTLPPPMMRQLDAHSQLTLELQPHALALVMIPHNPAFQR